MLLIYFLIQHLSKRNDSNFIECLSILKFPCLMKVARVVPGFSVRVFRSFKVHNTFVKIYCVTY